MPAVKVLVDVMAEVYDNHFVLSLHLYVGLTMVSRWHRTRGVNCFAVRSVLYLRDGALIETIPFSDKDCDCEWCRIHISKDVAWKTI